MNVAIDDDLERAYDRLRPVLALYVGGMGAKEMNFHADVFRRLGHGAAVERIQSLFLDGRQNDAIGAVPNAMIDEICLVGPEDKVRDDLAAWRESRVTTMLVGGSIETLRTMAEVVLGLVSVRQCSPRLDCAIDSRGRRRSLAGPGGATRGDRSPIRSANGAASDRRIRDPRVIDRRVPDADYRRVNRNYDPPLLSRGDWGHPCACSGAVGCGAERGPCC